MMEIWGHTQTNAKIDQTNDTTGSNSNCRYGHESKSRGKQGVSLRFDNLSHEYAQHHIWKGKRGGVRLGLL